MPLSEKQLEQFRTDLVALREQLNDLSTISSDARKPVELDQTSVGRLSRMDALQGQAMQLETERRREQEQQRIRSAIERIADGEFGFCLTCGEDISLKRLQHDPSIPTCIDCAQRS